MASAGADAAKAKANAAAVLLAAAKSEVVFLDDVLRDAEALLRAEGVRSVRLMQELDRLVQELEDLEEKYTRGGRAGPWSTYPAEQHRTHVSQRTRPRKQTRTL